MSEQALAIVAGTGRLPELLASAAAKMGRKVVLVCFNGYRPDWRTDQPLIEGVFEKPGALFKSLHKAGCTEIVFAGYIIRPRINPLKFDIKMVSLAAKLLPKLKMGDGATLDAVKAVFEGEGLKIIGAHELLSDLLAPSGTITKSKPSDDDLSDLKRAQEILAHLGNADVGQGAVVAQGLCLGLESIQGTDAMLDFIARTSENYRPDEKAGQGVLLKAPKVGQDWRIDLPTIGPQTLERAANAGLSGVAVQANAVLILDPEETVEIANKHGLFIHCFEVEG